MIVRRPAVGVREELRTGDLDVDAGLVGDTWNMRSSRRTADGSPHPDMQLNIMSSQGRGARGAGQGALGARRRSAVRGSRFERSEPAGRHPPRHRRRHRRGDGPAAYRLRQIRRAVRAGGDEVRELAARTRAAPARHQRPRRPTRTDPGWRHGAQSCQSRARGFSRASRRNAGYFFFAANAFACWPTISTRLPIARFTSIRCSPQLASGWAAGPMSPVISSTRGSFGSP